MSQPLSGKRGLVVGIANDASIAAGCAQAFAASGAKLAATYLNEKALPYVKPVTDALGCELLLPCDVRIPGQLESVFEQIRLEWGHLDFLLHAIAFAPAADLATPPPNLVRKGSAPMRFRQGRSRPAPPAESTASTSYWPRKPPSRPNTSRWTSPMSATWRPSWSATPPNASPEQSFPSMAGNT